MSLHTKCYVVIEYLRVDDTSSKSIKAVFANEGEAEQCADRWNQEMRAQEDPTIFWVEEANYYA